MTIHPAPPGAKTLPGREPLRPGGARPQQRPALPLPATVLGVAGLVPFYACAAGAWFLPGLDGLRALDWLVAYGAVILSFLGGIHWGLAMAGQGAPPPPANAAPASMGWHRLGLAVAPSLVAWAAHLAGALQPALIVLTVGFALMGQIDLRAGRAGTYPVWFLPLRRGLTLAVLLALVIAAARTAFPITG